MPPTAHQQCRHDVIADQHADQNPMPRAPSPKTSEDEDAPLLSVPFRMETDDAGLYCVYITRPSNIPNNNTLEAVTDAQTLASDNQIPRSSLSSKGTEELFAAFSNPTSGLLMAYQYSGTGQQSVAELQHLTTFVGDPLFRHADVLSF
ncbi:hypothetical protein EDD22DRAFT_746501, partial [Suillus occidentalis]